MRLCLVEGGSRLVAYHVTPKSAVGGILECGVRSGMASRYGHCGRGIYVVFWESDERAVESCGDFAEYLGIDEFALVKTSVVVDSLLMDEDSLEQAFEDILYCFETSGEHGVFGRDFVVEYLRVLDGVDDEVERRVICLGLIDKYKIRPVGGYVVTMGHYDFRTARCVESVLPVGKVWVVNDDFELVLVG